MLIKKYIIFGFTNMKIRDCKSFSIFIYKLIYFRIFRDFPIRVSRVSTIRLSPIHAIGR